MKNISAAFAILAISVFLATSCAQPTPEAPESSAKADPHAADSTDLPDVQYVGYRVVHHMMAEVKHIEEFGLNTFEHPPIANYTFFVITPALDHF